jgi:hypothetical protein
VGGGGGVVHFLFGRPPARRLLVDLFISYLRAGAAG